MVGMQSYAEQILQASFVSPVGISWSWPGPPGRFGDKTTEYFFQTEVMRKRAHFIFKKFIGRDLLTDSNDKKFMIFQSLDEVEMFSHTLLEFMLNLEDKGKKNLYADKLLLNVETKMRAEG